MHPEQIKAALRMAGTTPTALADEMEVSSSAMSQVISGRAVSARIRARISQVTGIPVEMLWTVSTPTLRRNHSKKQRTAGAAA